MRWLNSEIRLAGRSAGFFVAGGAGVRKVGQTDFRGAVSEASPFLHRRIERAYNRMLAAQSPEWTHRWGDAFVVYIRARNAQRTPAEIRRIERARGLGR